LVYWNVLLEQPDLYLCVQAMEYASLAH